MNDKIDVIALIVLGALIGVMLGLGLGTSAANDKLQTRALESGDAHYHPITKRFFFNGEKK